MNLRRTEEASEQYRDIDILPGVDVLSFIASAQRQAIDAVADAAPALASAAEAIARRMQRGGRLVYAGAGSSGLLAQVDALELPPTYGIEAERIIVLIAGGREALFKIPGSAEDDAVQAGREVDALALTPLDSLVSISASGRTPYALAALDRAAAAGALTIGMASNAGAPLLERADHSVLLATPPEIIAGSTRMNAGTAQKCALNMLSTLIGIRLGHAYRGLMVNLQADNEKLHIRATGIVARAAEVDEHRAASALELAGGRIKPAIILAAGAQNLQRAQALLDTHGGDVRQALASLVGEEHKTDSTDTNTV